MDLTALRTLTRDLNFSAHGTAITVTRPLPDDGPITTTGIWVRPLTESQPVGTDLRRRETRKVMVIPRDAVMTQVPRGTVVVAAEQGAAARNWRVDGYEVVAADYFRVILVPVSEVLN